MATITIKNLTKKYDGRPCLDRVNLDVAHGEMVVIVGPSGCGKTTLMRCIVGLEEIDSGSIYINEELVNDKEPKDRDVAMVFQYYSLYPHMTVRRNLSFGLEHTTTLSKDEIQGRVNEYAEILKINRLLDRKPGQLSGGESQRVAIGRALVREPQIIFLDEPLSAVDAKLRRELRAEIKKIQRNFEVTGIYVTHDQEEAMAVADKLVVLGNCKIHQIGTPDEVYNHPRDHFVASFIGKPPMNFFDMTVTGNNDGYYLTSDDFTLKISKDYFEKYISSYHEKKLSVGIRPSSINIIGEKDKDLNCNQITATVTEIEDMGDEQHVLFSIGKTHLTVKISPENSLAVGDKICLTVNEEDIHLFDSEYGYSLKL